MTTAVKAQRRLGWERGYAARLFLTDLIIVVAAVLGSQFLRFGGSSAELEVWRIRGDGDETLIGYTVISVILIAAWMLYLDFFATRDHKIIGSGSTEYRRLADATLRLFGAFAILVFLLKIDLGRSYLLMALPSGLLLLMFSRWAWRRWLQRRRIRGEYIYRALLVGDREKTEHVVESIHRDHTSGLVAVGALTQQGRPGERLAEGVPVLGGFADALEVVDGSGVDTVILTGADDISPRDMRQLGWDLESRGVSLIVAPALTDVAGPRIHARPVAGLPLIHVEYPSFEGRRHVIKRGFDILASAGLLAVLSPIFLWIWIAVRTDSPGPALFRQERVGLNGKPFKMLKFRSMVVDAEAQLPSLLDQSDGNGVLFKLKADPRVTRVGGFLRRYSLDELPQLLNVFRGDMSLVGPRPPLAAEVAQYDDWAHRRLLVKPGITGLWQVSGRSNLSWEDSLRLDLYYVENWSLTGDIIILYRTVKAVAMPDGAY
ncbi:sugar transferase [Planctomonas deserti]|uniref:sugar transferase n=1 Tax=Planctomonas deserti TaxID=2144185 RepID=UPI000D3CCB72|nr:sugar transferase [Planctomonas deserti]